MEEILDKETDHNNIRALEHLKYELNSTNSDDEHMEDDEDSKDAVLAIEENILKEESSMGNDDFSTGVVDIKAEDILDLGSDIILPQASQSHNFIIQKQRKEAKSRKELEEEEREKMQYVPI